MWRSGNSKQHWAYQKSYSMSGPVSTVSKFINIVPYNTARFHRLWVTILGQANHLGMQPATQANSASYPTWDGKRQTSTGQSAMMACSWKVQAGLVIPYG